MPRAFHIPQPSVIVVQRQGQATLPVDVDAIAKFCQRGPKDCNYAIDRMLLDLRSP